MSAASVPRGHYELFANDDDVIRLTIARTSPHGYVIVRTDPPHMDAFDEYAVAQFLLAQLNKAGAIGTCGEREKRAAMTDAEFWAHVFPAEDPNPRVLLPGWGEGDQAHDADVYPEEACPICHATGACGWDDNGLPLIHAKGSE